MRGAGRLVDETAGPRHPIIFEVAPAPFERYRRDEAAVAMRAEMPALLHPENVCEGVVAHIEEEVPDEDIFDIGHPRRILLRASDEAAGAAVCLDHIGERLRHRHDSWQLSRHWFLPDRASWALDCMTCAIALVKCDLQMQAPMPTCLRGRRRCTIPPRLAGGRGHADA